MPKCVVLHSSKPYSEENHPRLREILDQRPDLFASVGVGCEGWEEAMDWLCVELNTSGEIPSAFCNTTSHPGEALTEVVEFAEQWCDLKGWRRNVEVIEI